MSYDIYLIKLKTLKIDSFNFRSSFITEYDGFKAIAREMRSAKINASIIDAYEASDQTELFADFRVGKIIQDNKVFGVVFGRSMSDSKLYDNFVTWLETNQERVLRAVESNVKNFVSVAA